MTRKQKNNTTRSWRLAHLVLLVPVLFLFFSCCLWEETDENHFTFSDLKTGQPIAGVQVAAKKEETVFTKIADFFTLYPDSYERRFSDKNGRLVWKRNVEYFGITTSHKFSHVCVLNGKAFTFNISEAELGYSDGYGEALYPTEGGGLRVDAVKFSQLNEIKKRDTKAILARNEVANYYYRLQNDGSGNFSLGVRRFHVPHPVDLFRISPTFLRWKIGEAPAPQKMLVTINAKTAIKITDVILEPNIDFTVEISPLRSREELKQIPSAWLHDDDGIENNYVLTVTPRTTEHAAHIKSFLLKTDPKLPEHFREPYYTYITMRVDDWE